MFGSSPGNQGPYQSAQTFGRLRGGQAGQGVAYPSPFFDLAHTYLPPTVKEMFKWCRYYYLTQPLVAATVNKMAEYPITDLVFDTDNRGLKDTWENFFSHDVQLRPRLIDIGLYYWCYGSAVMSMMHPFVKWLRCTHCKHTIMAKKATYKFRNFEFWVTCKKCGEIGRAEVHDQYLKTARGTKIILWNPEDIDIVFNPVTQESSYFYNIPRSTKNDITMGRREILEQLPQVFIEAAKKSRSVTLNKDNLFHLKRPSVLSGPRDSGWGTSIILPVLKDIFYLQVMKKAQEAILLERIVPLTVIFPQQASGTADPYCVSLDTLVETREGLRPASEVSRGDYLRSHRGRWKKVKAVVDRLVDSGEAVYEFSVSSVTAFPFKVSEGHPILAAKRPNKKWEGYNTLGEPEWVEAKDLQEKDFVCYPTHRPTWSSLALDLAEYNPEKGSTENWVYRRLSHRKAEIYEFFESEGFPKFDTTGLPKNASPLQDFLSDKGWSIEDYNSVRATIQAGGPPNRKPRYLPVTEDLAFLIGLYAAEGCPKGDIATLTLNEQETDLMDKADICLSRMGYKVMSRSAPRAGAVECGIEDIILSRVFFTCGLGAQNKGLPRFILEAPRDIAMAALDSLFQGDGCDFQQSSARQGRRIGLKTTSPQLAMDARVILLSVGILPIVHKSTPRKDEIAKLPYYQVDTNGSQAEYLGYLLGRSGAPQYSKNKLRKGWSSCGFFRDGFVYMRVKNIRRVDSVRTVRGFQITGDKSFCVAGVATHNTSINLVQWKDHIAKEIQRWRQDRNYVPILPLPIGHQVIGGDGRALMMSQEIKIWSDHIVAGMGVPNEFIYGGLQWSGSNVSLRMLENQFMRYLSGLRLFITDFVVKHMHAHMGWPKIDVRFKPFKMADDLQRKAYLFQLNQAGKVSDTTLLNDSDLAPEEENELLDKETNARLEAVKKQQIAEAEIAGEAGVVNAKYQAKAQTVMAQEQQQAQMGAQGTAPGEPSEMTGGQPVQPGQDPNAAGQAPNPAGGQQNPIQGIVERLRSLSPDAQQHVLRRIAGQNPDLAQQIANQIGMGGKADVSPNSQNRALPTQLPPRRGPETAMI